MLKNRFDNLLILVFNLFDQYRLRNRLFDVRTRTHHGSRCINGWCGRRGNAIQLIDPPVAETQQLFIPEIEVEDAIEYADILIALLEERVGHVQSFGRIGILEGKFIICPGFKPKPGGIVFQIALEIR